MSVANRELSEELYKLSGWLKGTEKYWFFPEAAEAQLINKPFVPNGFNEEVRCPAYGLGYLIRKLQTANTKVTVSIDETGAEVSHIKPGKVLSWHDAQAISPEDALCKLALELFKQGILKKEAMSEPRKKPTLADVANGTPEGLAAVEKAVEASHKVMYPSKNPDTELEAILDREYHCSHCGWDMQLSDATVNELRQAIDRIANKRELKSLRLIRDLDEDKRKLQKLLEVATNNNELIANKRALEAQVEEIEHWLRMVAWPNDYQTMKKSMKERKAELQSLINPTELEPDVPTQDTLNNGDN